MRGGRLVGWGEVEGSRGRGVWGRIVMVGKEGNNEMSLRGFW